MIESSYNEFLKLTGEPIAAAMLTLAQTIEAKPDTVALTVKQAAKTMGVSIGTVYELCSNGRLQHERIGRKGIRILQDSLENLRRETTTGGVKKGRFLK